MTAADVPPGPGPPGLPARSADLPPPRRHADDHAGPQVAHCPFCGRSLDTAAFVQEYWTGSTRNFHLWCPACDAVAEVITGGHTVTHEPAH
jgi:hypothetical protein